jgi:putative transposase
MTRRARLFLPGFPIHAMQRGHNRQEVFRNRGDYQFYLMVLFEAVEALQIELHAYVLMPNHVHLLLSCSTKSSLSRLFQSVGRRYVQYFNHRYVRTGTLWEGRYRSCTVDSERYLLECYRYIELNPVRARLVERAQDYLYSSYRHHAGFETDSRLKDHEIFWRIGNTPFDRQSNYKGLIAEGMHQSGVSKITHATLNGWHLGAGNHLLSHDQLHPKARGRPQKVRQQNDSVPI